jgi:hypothetical protein
MNYRAAFLVGAGLGISVAVFACSGDSTTAPDLTTPGDDSGATGDPDTSVTPAVDSGSHPAVDAGGGKDATVDGAPLGDSGAMDGSTDGNAADSGTVLNGCSVTGDAGTAFVDKSGGGRTITFSQNATATQYSIPCMRIKVTQKVKWTGSFALYPLEPKGGAVPSPILLTANGTSTSFTFNAVGVYGFDSTAKPAVMFGAIEVTP